ncbi:MAG: DUF4258 domain-containing protein [Alphaproteobacteria bacterium]
MEITGELFTACTSPSLVGARPFWMYHFNTLDNGTGCIKIAHHDDPMPFRKRPIHWDNLRADQAEELVHQRARDTSNIGWHPHALERQDERAITTVEVLRILRTGHVEGEPELLDHGDWKVIMTKRMPGTREAGVVTVIFREGERLYVRTVEWMDWLR